MNPEKKKGKRKKKVKIDRVEDLEKKDPVVDKTKSDKEKPVKEDSVTDDPEQVQVESADEIKKEERVLTDEEKIAKLEVELALTRDELLRERASFINYRKRTEEEKAQIRRFGAQDLAFDLLTILDYFEESLKFEAKEQDANAIIQGIKFTVEEFHKMLGKHGIKEIDTNIPFDPKIHEAFCTDDTSEQDPGTILKTHRKGYLYKDRVLRPAMVTVAVNHDESSEESNENGRTDQDSNKS